LMFLHSSFQRLRCSSCIFRENDALPATPSDFEAMIRAKHEYGEAVEK
jgi:hypothetical protein